MLCGICWRDVDRTVMGEYSGIPVCEDCYWEEVEAEDASAALSRGADEARACTIDPEGVRLMDLKRSIELLRELNDQEWEANAHLTATVRALFPKLLDIVEAADVIDAEICALASWGYDFDLLRMQKLENVLRLRLNSLRTAAGDLRHQCTAAGN